MLVFFVAKSASGKELFILGGNQGDKVSIAKYLRNVWQTFVVPKTFDKNSGRLPVYTHSAEEAGSEA